MKSIKNLMMVAAIVALPFMFTSCGDSLGDQDNPAPVMPDEPPSGVTSTYPQTPNNPLLLTPLTLEATSAGTFVVDGLKPGMQYKMNDGDKTPVTSTAIDVQAGDKVAFFGDGTSITCYTGTKFSNSTAEFIVYGNIMSLVDENNFSTATELTADLAFYSLFSSCNKLTYASGLMLPATTLTKGCYFNMFTDCTALEFAPELPAMTLKPYCYTAMFKNCPSLVTGPALPATTLADHCYHSMFFNELNVADYKLKNAPELPATTLAESCYGFMFFGCKSLTTAPDLPAQELKTACYVSMFADCTSLKYLKCLATSIAPNAVSPTHNWLQNVPASGIFVKDASVNYGPNEFWDVTDDIGSTTRCAAKVLFDGNWTVTNAE